MAFAFETASLNSDCLHKDNKTGLRTQFNHKNSGNNYIRGKTEIVGSELKVITKKGIIHHGHGKVSSFGSLNSGWCHLITNAPQFYMNKNHILCFFELLY